MMRRMEEDAASDAAAAAEAAPGGGRGRSNQEQDDGRANPFASARPAGGDDDGLLVADLEGRRSGRDRDGDQDQEQRQSDDAAAGIGRTAPATSASAMAGAGRPSYSLRAETPLGRLAEKMRTGLTRREHEYRGAAEGGGRDESESEVAEEAMAGMTSQDDNPDGSGTICIEGRAAAAASPQVESIDRDDRIPEELAQEEAGGSTSRSREEHKLLVHISSRENQAVGVDADAKIKVAPMASLQEDSVVEPPDADRSPADAAINATPSRDSGGSASDARASSRPENLGAYAVYPDSGRTVSAHEIRRDADFGRQSVRIEGGRAARGYDDPDPAVDATPPGDIEAPGDAAEELETPCVTAYVVSEEEDSNAVAEQMLQRMMREAVVVEGERIAKEEPPAQKGGWCRKRLGSRWCRVLLASLTLAAVVAIAVTAAKKTDPIPIPDPLSRFCNDDGTACWVSIGPSLRRPSADEEMDLLVEDEFGEDISLSGDGSRLAVSAKQCNVLLSDDGQVHCAPEDGDGKESAGAVWVYDLAGGGNRIDIGRTPIGEFYGEENDETTGNLSGDGKRVAIAARFRPGKNNTKDVGEVQFYEYKSPDNWQELGSPIEGKAAYDKAGKDTALSYNGSIVAVSFPGTSKGEDQNGTVRIYKFDDDLSDWEQLGSDLVGESVNDQFGWSVQLSDDGGIAAIGAKRNDGGGSGEEAGHARVFRLVSGDWQQMGEDIDGAEEGDQFGGNLKLSADGMTLAVGGWDHDGINGVDSGHVRIFKYDAERNTWEQVGNTIFGAGKKDHFGKVSISADGKRLATASSGKTKGKAGYVRVYEYLEGEWGQLGGTLESERTGDNFGMSFSISDDGARLAIGAPSRHSDDIRGGYVRVYDLVESS